MPGSQSLPPIRTRGIEIVDDDGQVRMVVGKIPGNHSGAFGIQINAHDGAKCAVLLVDSWGSRLCLLEEGSEVASLAMNVPQGVGDAYGPDFFLARRDGQPVYEVAVSFRDDDEATLDAPATWPPDWPPEFQED